MDTINRQQVEAYGAYWVYTVYDNGITATMRRAGKSISPLWFATWADLVNTIKPVAWTRVFVRRNNSVFLPR